MSIMYRLERNDAVSSKNKLVGQGVYRDGFRAGGADGCNADNTDTHPTPRNDPKLNKALRAVGPSDNDFWESIQPYLFGFRSPDQLHTWFSELHTVKYYDLDLMQIGVYYIPDKYYLAGTFQCMGIGSEMVRVDTWHPMRKE